MFTMNKDLIDTYLSDIYYDVSSPASFYGAKKVMEIRKK